MSKRNLKFDMNPLFGGPTLEARTRSGSPYRLIPLTEIDADPTQPRRAFDTEALAELAASIKEHGVICPIMVRVTAGGTYRVVAGERRLRASRLLGLETIPAVIDSDEEGIDTLAKQLVENIQRQDLAPIERALAIGQLREQHGWSVRDIAKKLGASKSMVQRSLELLELPEDLRIALEQGASESKVLLLQAVENKQQRGELLRRLESMSRQELQEEIQELVHGGQIKVSHGGTAGSGTSKAKSATSVEDQRIVDELKRSLGSKVQLLRSKQRRGQGRLVLEFYSDDDLRELFKRLTN